MIKENKRNLVIISAGQYLVEQENGDLYDAYVKLVESQENDDAPYLASQVVEVWEGVEDITVCDMIDIIESGVTLLESQTSNVPEFLTKMDWKLLKNQKQDLIDSIEDFKIESKEAFSAGEEQLAERYNDQIESLTGILHLIDSIQDYTLDTLKINESDVFNSIEED